MMTRKLFFPSALILVMLAVLAGCIKNDLPFPKAPQLITSLVAVGESQPAVIDSAAYKVTVYLDEQTDIRSVSFSEFTYTEGADCSENLLEGVYDLSSPLVVTLSKWQTYQWSVNAVQDIERYFTVEGQFGQTVIDAVGRRVVVRVPESADLSKLLLTSVKLGQKDVSKMTPDLQPGPIDLSRPLRVSIETFGRVEDWTIYAEKTEVTVQTVSADAWSQVVWVYGMTAGGREPIFQYRLASDVTWTDVPASCVTSEGNMHTARIPHLEPMTDYVVRCISGEDLGEEINVTTQATRDLPNGDFENWWQSGKNWYPYAEGGDPFWDTGNRGVTITGPSNVTPSDYTPDGTGRAARLESVFASVLGIGKLGAGSIFTGSFVRIDGTNGILAFGREWNLRPTRLRGFYQYNAATIDYVQDPYKSLKGRPDSCQVYIALTDWERPDTIRTNPRNRHLFDPNSSSIIAYGQMTVSETGTSYKPFEIELVYRSTSRVPRFLQITAAASKYGDFFTGGAGSVLFVDQFSLDYDY